MPIFKEPEGKFSLPVPKGWKYVKHDDKSRKNLHQFQITPSEVFQISLNPVNDRIAEMIKQKAIIPHDPSMPNISYIEDYLVQPPREMYQWMALIDDQFIFAVYFFEPNLKDMKKLGIDLFEIRMGLRNIIIPSKPADKKPCPGFFPEVERTDYMNIDYWGDRPKKYFENLGKDKKHVTSHLPSLNVDAVELYALLTIKVSQQPNGFLDLMKIGQPLDNPIWWDFILECPKGYIQVLRTPFLIEAHYFFDSEFDVQSFFENNIKQNKRLIDEKIKTFERHTLYINHYQSYSGCVETLWKEIKEMDLTIPKGPTSHLTSDDDRNAYTKNVEKFLDKSIRYHALAKSLVLNAAFKIESFLNLVIRIGSLPELRLYPDVLSKFLKQEFAVRIKNLRFYVQILIDDIDMTTSLYRETKELMNLRNKYVHYEEDTIHNRLGEIRYDRDYPLHQVTENRPAIDAAINTYHHPDLITVKKAYETSNKFVEMIEGLFIPKIKGNLKFLIQQNPIGYNENKGIYSAVYSPIALDFFTGMHPEPTSEDPN